MPDGEIDLASAALQLARVSEPEWRYAASHLSEIARDAVALSADVPPGDLVAQAATLAGLMVGRHHYTGDSETYDDLDNANLIRVIERRRGLPVALGILWLHAAQAAGWEAYGVNFPGHFLIKLKSGQAEVVLDVFRGGTVLDQAKLLALVRHTQGPTAQLQTDMFAPMGARDVLLRLQTNIRSRLLALGQFNAALACTEDMLRIAPDEALLWREAALMNQRLDHVSAALRCFGRFLELVPAGDAAARARAAVHELRARLN